MVSDALAMMKDARAMMLDAFALMLDGNAMYFLPGRVGDGMHKFIRLHFGMPNGCLEADGLRDGQRLPRKARAEEVVGG